MVAIVGLLVVIGAIIGGYLMEHGNLKVLMQPEKFKDQVEITVTSEGLRVELLETASGTFFDSGSAKPNDRGKELLTMLAQELGKLPNKVNIEGHTDSKPYVGG